MPTKTVRLFEDDVEKVKRESRLNPDASFASHANEVLGRIDGEAVEGAVRGALENGAGD